MKGTIVAQVDSSESFQEFCSTGCLAAYENKQVPPKSAIKTKCTVCGKLTEVSASVGANAAKEVGLNPRKHCRKNCLLKL